MTAETLNTHHELIGITAFDGQHRKEVEHCLVLGLLLLGVPEDEEKEPAQLIHLAPPTIR